MRKITLLLLSAAVGASSFGQVKRAAELAPVVQYPGTDKAIVQSPVKGGGDVFWSTTFNWGNVDTFEWSMPDGWSITDNTEFGNPWMWRSPKDSIGGQFVTKKMGPAKNLVSSSDGFLVIPIDEYNYRDGIETRNIADTYVTTPIINCSSKTSVTVRFNQYFRNCCTNTPTLQMLVTNDGGVHWATYDCNYGLSANRITDDRYLKVEFNISDVAAGMANVQLKFYYTGSYLYYWMIDDLELSEAYQNDLVLADYWSDFNGGFDTGVGHINYWPLTQLGMPSTIAGNIGEYTFKGAFLNNGMADQENARIQMTVLKNGTQAFQDASSPVTIWSLERDTSTVNSVFLANDYGDYRFNFNAISDNNEEVPANNGVSQSFTVNDTLMHRADFTTEAGSNTGGWVGGGNAGDMVGVFYDVYATCEVNSITAFINSVTMAETPTFQYVLLKDVGGELVELITSEVTDATDQHKGAWVTLDMQKDGETEFLEPGSYVACVRFWGTKEGDADGTNGISIGWDKDNTADAYTYMYQAVGGSWYNSNNVNQIGFNINAAGGPTQAPVTFNVDMNKHIASGEFKPGTDFVDVAGSFNNWSGSSHLTDANADGIYTITLDGMPVGKVIEYKYRINGDWNTSEYPNGGPNRKYTVRYWNILDNKYNGGNTTGTDQASLFTSFSVYPNPTSGDFTVEIANADASDLVITLTNIQGQVVYQNKVTHAVNHQETISGDLSKGMYFLSVNSGKEVKVQKVIVQ